jgi:hypothetical protein
MVSNESERHPRHPSGKGSKQQGTQQQHGVQQWRHVLLRPPWRLSCPSSSSSSSSSLLRLLLLLLLLLLHMSPSPMRNPTRVRNCKGVPKWKKMAYRQASQSPATAASVQTIAIFPTLEDPNTA